MTFVFVGGKTEMIPWAGTGRGRQTDRGEGAREGEYTVIGLRGDRRKEKY